MRRTLLAPLAGAVLAAAAQADFLLVPDSSTDKVMLFDAADGSLVDVAFLDMTLAPAASWSPHEVIEVGDELWVADRGDNFVFRFSRDGKTYLGSLTSGLNNLRGICFTNGSLYVTNSATGGGGAGYGDACLEYAPGGALLNVFPVGDPFDVIENGGELLVADIANDNLERYAYDGTWLGTFHDSDGVTGIDFPSQLVRQPDGHVLASGLSVPQGVYEYDASGNQVGYWDTSTISSLLGLAKLDNGNFFVSNWQGVYEVDATTGAISLILSCYAQTITRVTGFGPGTAYCFGDGLGTPCPCGNDNDGSYPFAGCANGYEGGGASLLGFGSPKVSADTLVLDVNGAPPGQPGLFFRADNRVNGGQGNVFGDGLRCAGGNVVRLQVVFTDALGHAASTAAAGAGLVAGDLKRYQFWYRNPGTTPCGSAFNLTNGYEITWAP
ncbi:MAG: hypothetical protein H6828_06920 [Planctomycetes bacterium]|nr:hypothetical protein [Planctomycetota bacterium]